MQWYVDYFRDEDLRITDPTGYALGVTVGFILIPLAVIGILVFTGALIYERHQNKKPDTSTERTPTP